MMKGTNIYLLRLIHEQISREFKVTYLNFFKIITTKLDDKALKSPSNSATGWIPKNTYTTKDIKKISNEPLKQDIANTIGFDISLWSERNHKIQEDTIKKAIERFLDKKRGNMKLNLPTYKELKKELNKEEQALLKELKNGNSEAFKIVIANKPNLSQEMYLAITYLAYDFGYYQHLVNYLFPILKMSNKMKTEILFIYANALGSHQLKEYKEASLILKSINTQNNLLYIDIKTAMTSNNLRNLLDKDLDKNELREILYSQTKNYKILFEKDAVYHYYPAINYGYMIAITKELYSKDKEFKKLNTLNIAQLSKLSQKSIEQDKKSNKEELTYYASITELEFSLIANKDILLSLQDYLEDSSPDITLISRTLRQIIFFRDILKQSIDEISFDMDRLGEVIDVIEGYIFLKSEET